MDKNQKAKAAIKAMKDIGIPVEKTKPALKQLLKLYDKNWDLIEEENYRVLADAIFEYEDSEAAEKEKKKIPANVDQGKVFEEAAQAREEPERPLKRLRLKHQGQAAPSQGQHSPTSTSFVLKTPKPEPGEPETSSSQLVQPLTGSPQSILNARNKGKQPVLPQVCQRDARTALERPSQALQIKEPTFDSRTTSRQKQPNVSTLIKPKDEPFTDDMLSLEPLAVVLPDCVQQEIPSNSSNPTGSRPECMRREFPYNSGKILCSQGGQGSGTSKSVNGIDKGLGSLTSPSAKEHHIQKVDISKRTPTFLDIATSSLGKVKLSLCYNSGPEGNDFCFPDLESVLKKFNDNCLHKYKIMDPEFSIMKVMDEYCEYVGKLGTNADGVNQERSSQQDTGVISSNGICFLQFNGSVDAELPDDVAAKADIAETDALNPTSAFNSELVYGQSCKNATAGNCAESNSSVANLNTKSLVVVQQQHLNPTTEIAETAALNPTSTSKCEPVNMKSDENASDNCAERDSSVEELDTKSLVVVQQQLLNPTAMQCIDVTCDITRGMETVKVSLEKINCDYSPLFHYIPQNVISHNADVIVSLAQIGDQDCCHSCLGNCLALSLSCNCARRNGGESSYTSDGLVREEFLDKCILMAQNPQKDNLVYCEECPLECLKNEDMLDPCKGHLKRKFIKECWTKCGCNKNCGNRVVQQGISRNLQVFWTLEGKGWGLRTLEDLPKGTFVCEYVGEILTITELHKRNLRRSNDKHSYAVVLDTDWGTKALKEGKILCLDATVYGNVSRFINHRCSDANLIEIPVEVETPNHHYYHVALFTTRKVNAFEELTWDYGVDFDDGEHHIKTFSCLCGSNSCRNMKRSNRLIFSLAVMGSFIDAFGTIKVMTCLRHHI